MEKFQLSILFKIIGIGSASGLVYHEDKLYIISDNSSFLYEYTISNKNLNKIALVENPQETIIKKDKPDFESISFLGNKLYILGSGSTNNRNKVVKYNPTSKKINDKDFSIIFQDIKTQLDIKDEELNIEGLIQHKNIIYLFQRGNGANSKNGIIYSNEDIENRIFKFVPFDLPKIKNVSATFTDAILIEDKIYFLAAAEDTTSTYDDGEVLGSIIGTIDLKTMKILNSIQISDTHKFEGLTLYKKTATQIELLLCEDTDTEDLETTIYTLAIRN
ncbi:DUF6929 family protein [Flavobacterium sp.]|jgi:hypothetical protein|uniref:DUF6929 family protein n=1 Tax=Flavobacterium sp. TaxID=239 RepID=UPI0037C0FD22